MKVHVIVKGFKFSNRTYDPYTGQLIPNRIDDEANVVHVSWANILCCKGAVNARIDGAYSRYRKMLDLPKFMKEMKYLKVAMRGLLSADQHNFCNKYANNAFVDDAEDSEDLVDASVVY